MKALRVVSGPLQIAAVVFALAFMATQGAPVSEAQAQAKPLKKVRIAVGTTVLNVGSKQVWPHLIPQSILATTRKATLFQHPGRSA